MLRSGIVGSVRMKRVSGVALAAMLAAIASAVTAQAPADGAWRPTRAEVARAEAAIVLPARARAARDDYQRTYAGSVVDGQKVIRGVWLKRRGGAVAIVDSVGALPRVFDGGCAVIEVRFTAATGVATADCHGYA